MHFLNIRQQLEEIVDDELGLVGHSRTFEFLHHGHSDVYRIRAGGHRFIAHAASGSKAYLRRVRDNLDRLAEYPIAGGNIKNAMLNAARAAAHAKSKKITMQHFVTAIEREAKALQAFAAEYEKQLHTSIAGQASGTTTGATIGRKDVGPVQKMLTKAKGVVS